MRITSRNRFKTACIRRPVASKGAATLAGPRRRRKRRGRAPGGALRAVVGSGGAGPPSFHREPRLTADGANPHSPPRSETGRRRQFIEINGAVAQLGERRVRNAKVRGSIPLGSTKFINDVDRGLDAPSVELATK